MKKERIVIIELHLLLPSIIFRIYDLRFGMKRDLYKTSHNENLTKYYYLNIFLCNYLLKKIEDDNLEFIKLNMNHKL